jgi:hypothetical protein
MRGTGVEQLGQSRGGSRYNRMKITASTMGVSTQPLMRPPTNPPSTLGPMLLTAGPSADPDHTPAATKAYRLPCDGEYLKK